MANIAAWIPAKGEPFKLGPADIPTPGPGELVIENQAIPLHPGDWKLAKGIIPIPLTYPAILGNYVTGYIHAVGGGVERFKKGDRVLSMAAVALRNDHQFGAHQRYTLSTQLLTSHIGDVPFEDATSASIVYAAMSALTLYLGLDRPSKDAVKKGEKVLIWGGGSTMGWFGVQIAVQAGYQVLTTSSPEKLSELKDLGASGVIDYHLPAPTLLKTLSSLGPYRTIFDATGSSSAQTIIGDLLAAQGGGMFITTMPIHPSVKLAGNVEGKFVQYADDYLKLENEEYAKWVFWTYLEDSFKNGSLKMGSVEVIGGLNKVGEGLGRLERGEVRGKLVVKPNLQL